MPALTAYLCAKYPYKLSAIIVVVYTLMMCMPIVGSTPFELTFLRNTGLYDNIIGNYIQKMTGSGMYFFVYLAYFKGTSETYREAAQIDGASQLRIMTTIYFPLAIKIIATVFLIQFVALWNDYQTPLLYLPDFPTVASGIYQIKLESASRGDTPSYFAGLTLSVAPVLVLYACFSDTIMKNFNMGGLKG